MLLKDVLVCRGIAFLEPKCVEMKGFQNQELEVHQATDFRKGLCIRLGYEISLVQAALL
jgi:RecQ-mediated genome instability protein 1